jgi:hypothetical protein
MSLAMAAGQKISLKTLFSKEKSEPYDGQIVIGGTE